MMGEDYTVLLTNKEAKSFLMAAAKKEFYFCKRLGETINSSSVSRLSTPSIERGREMYVFLDDKGFVHKYFKKGNDYYGLLNDGTVVQPSKNKDGEYSSHFLNKLFDQEEFFDADTNSGVLPESVGQKLLDEKK